MPSELNGVNNLMELIQGLLILGSMTHIPPLRILVGLPFITLKKQKNKVS
jgi:hypothetical protein